MQRSESSEVRLAVAPVFLIVLAIAGIVLIVASAVAMTESFFPAYLSAFVYWSEIALGCLGVLLVAVLIRSRWGAAVQRPALVGGLTLAVLAILFVPILFGLNVLYPWTAPDYFELAHLSPDRINYLTLWFWVLRSVVAFVVWIGLAFLLRSALHSYDESGSDDAQRRVRNIAGVGAVFFAVTGAFVASVDWTMSLDPYWFSSLYGWLAVARQAMVGLAFLIVTLLFLVRYESVANVVNQRVVNDLAMLQLGTIMVWGYMQYFQYLIMWHANLPKEARWYEPRMTGGWEYFALFLIVFNLVIPLILLLIPVPKKTLAYVSIVSVLVLISHWVEVTWIVQPAFSPTLAISWLDIVLPLAVGALWLAGYFWFLGKERLIPVHHPVLDDLAEVEGDSFAHGELDTPASAVN